jgi:hypothetical protein
VRYTTFITGTEAFQGLWRSPGSAICPFGTGRLEARGHGGALENEESKVMGRCSFEHAADEIWALELNFVTGTERAALSGNYGNAAKSAFDPGPRKALKILIELAGHIWTSGHQYEHSPRIQYNTTLSHTLVVTVTIVAVLCEVHAEVGAAIQYRKWLSWLPDVFYVRYALRQKKQLRYTHIIQVQYTRSRWKHSNRWDTWFAFRFKKTTERERGEAREYYGGT